MKNHLRSLAHSLGRLMSQPSKSRQAALKKRRMPRTRLELEPLEGRSLLSATATSTLTGFVFVDQNSSGGHDTGEASLPGISVTLTGTDNQGAAVNVTATTDLNGTYRFLNMLPGTYNLTTTPVKNFLGFDNNNVPGVNGTLGEASASNITVGDGETVNQDLGFRGLDPNFISLRLLLSTTQLSSFPFSPPGNGQNTVGPRENSAPLVKSAISDVSIPVNSADKVIDLAGVFTDPDITNSQVRFDITSQPAGAASPTKSTVTVDLFDKTAPQTVANFLNYVNRGDYNNSVFHRLATGFVLQGGGFKLNTTKPGDTSLDTIPTDPAVQNEFGASNTIGTVAMAKLGNDPNSATDQFFFNLADNSSNLDNQNGGFTVFGKVDSATDQATVASLATTPVSAQDTPFDQIPLNNFPSGSSFPADANASNFLVVNDVTVTKQDEKLTYSVVNNTNPSLVVATIKDNRLTLHYPAGQTGTATLTIRATDKLGATVDTSFTITVS